MGLRLSILHIKKVTMWDNPALSVSVILYYGAILLCSFAVLCYWPQFDSLLANPIQSPQFLICCYKTVY